MQPLFEASGWALPKNIAQEAKRDRKHATQEKSTEVTKEADQLQAQLSSLSANTKKDNNKKRPLEDSLPKTEKPKKKKSKQNNNNKQEQGKQKDNGKPENKKNDKQDQKGKSNGQKGKKQAKNQQKEKLQKLLAKNDKKKQPVKEDHSNKTSVPAAVVASSKKVDLDAGLTPLQRKMKEKLSGARFRWLNEQLYTTPGNKSFELFQEKPELFDEYHEGFRHQVESWPVNPVDVIIDQLKHLPKTTVIADLGCGDAMIAQTLKKHKVLSFDLIAKNELVTACDISKLPLEANSVDVVVFSLSLMGTNYLEFLKEAHRVLKVGGELKIAEVVSRFSDIDRFISLLEELGFDFMDKDDNNKMFVMLYFTKQPNYEEEVEDEVLSGLTKTQKRALKKGAGMGASKNKLQKKAQQLLKPCLYKKR
ncbi:hypothetical protein G6F46_012126 [Rhizopus delemar]|uniref:Ribosomal RNA-processing protein 8 n=3 Tax=Rhizopus TaxID=4842 RepID=I1BR88_RHIO9|nr:hypothetical protein RO3G_03423 [Rhizopus delemar RA 99-880]KAG1454272.1 hypothetical protein G6F55_007702 [Rhizopus delemar]KAG1534290.1 hypothetical protein G6F51_012177 [Rhizopus arrhizus]KAG1488671.1 hypothetical protein G6F54_011950 [Rhizopus delemar]KAG1510368.1 hypothetical protein G6F52_010918 [Rhizopus delemar]|eukprot:EIE78718.1 hypothetical protein RO3G_03423 [Rhizopus delemar RA 99-880]